MEVWFTEHDNNNFQFSIKIKDTLFSGRSQYQKVDVLETVRFGRMLVLDDRVMLTEFDEFVYHEMITHVPLFAHPNPRKALVIGGGDGGTVREIVKHPTIEHVDMVEIDGVVVEKSREFLPFTACGMDDPKVTVRIEDGIKFVQGKSNEYDVIIVDSTDPIGPAVGLFSQEFYTAILNALTEDGIMVAQTESPLIHQKMVPDIYGELRKVFPSVSMFLASNISYIGFLWSFAFATRGRDHLQYFDEKRVATLESDLKYYNRDIHRAAFMLPTFARKLIE